MKLSVAICTYNGAKYIGEQLRSILDQTQKIDEIVVCDDGSTDDTLKIINDILNDTHNIEFHLYKNSPNLGVCANFDKAIHLCTGDIIFLSDQDDIWLREKVEKTVRVFEQNPQWSVLFSNGYLMDNMGKSFTDKKMFDVVGLNKEGIKCFKKGMALELLMKHNRATGAAMAFRKSFLPEFSIIHEATSSNGLPLHDLIIAFAAAERNSLGMIEEPLIKYRIHESQEAGFGVWLNSPPHTSNAMIPVKLQSHRHIMVSDKGRSRVAFGAKRISFKHSVLHHKVLMNAKEYYKHYGNAATEIISRDFWGRFYYIFDVNARKKLTKKKK